MDVQHQAGSRKIGRASSDTAVHYDGWQPDGSQWIKARVDATCDSSPGVGGSEAEANAEKKDDDELAGTRQEGA